MKVSVIMGVYNDIDTVGVAIESILNQTYGDFEFIICNDCSPDENINKKLTGYAEKDDRIVLCENTDNIGLAATLNKCLSMAQGEYIARMDSDDIAMPDRFAEQVEFLEAHKEYVMCGTNAIIFDENGDKKTTSYDGEVTLDTVFKSSGFIHPTMMIRRKELMDVGAYTVSDLTLRCEDYDLWNKLYAAGYKGYNLKNALLRYRENSSNIDKRKFKHYRDRAKIGFYWKKQHKLGFKYIIWCIRPLLVGMLPKCIYKRLH